MIDLEKLPKEIHENVQNDIAQHGEWATNSFLHMAPLSRMISDLQETDTDIVWLTVVLHTINFYGSKDPTPVHFVVAREHLEGNAITDNHAVDMLAREVVTYCQKMQKHFAIALANKEQEFVDLKLSDDAGYFLPGRDSLPNFICEKNDCNLIDLIFAEFIQTTGKAGANAAKIILESAKSRFSTYKNSEYQGNHRPGAWSLWIKMGEKASVFSPYLSILADVVWKDICEIKWTRETKNVPALTQSVHPSVAKILSPKIEMKEIESKLHMIHSGKVIATLPTIDPALIPAVTKGVGSLNSLYHHKLIRYECKAGFENWVSGNADVRLLKFEGGCTEIAERLGIKSKRGTEEVKNILYAQAHMHFYFDDGSSGNLIVLSKFRSPQSGREEGIMITLGPQLLPHYTFQTSKKGRLLIPVPELPPFISSSNSHAAQAALQMLVMQEFADQSIELAETGSIKISNEVWIKLAEEAGLSMSVFKQTLDRWLNDGNDGPRFLAIKDENRYSFGETYNKEEVFLIEQGFLRKKRQHEGKKSAAIRKKK